MVGWGLGGGRGRMVCHHLEEGGSYKKTSRWASFARLEDCLTTTINNNNTQHLVLIVISFSTSLFLCSCSKQATFYRLE
jgi:hypothetical protein